METKDPLEFSIPLWESSQPLKESSTIFQPALDVYLVETSNPLGAVVICPGGAYRKRAEHEGVVVAKKFNQFGLHAFVVQYRVFPDQHPTPLKDLSRAVRMIRSNASQWKIKRDSIAVCGFSAGGHLVGSLAVHGEKYLLKEEDSLHHFSNRPDSIILCYPVITSGKFAHQGSLHNLLGEEELSAELLNEFSLELHVTPQTPPAFLWHTLEDKAVPIENSLLFAEAMRKQGIPFELHIFPNGNHGLGLAKGNPHVSEWFKLCTQWLEERGWWKNTP